MVFVPVSTISVVKLLRNSHKISSVFAFDVKSSPRPSMGFSGTKSIPLVDASGF